MIEFKSKEEFLAAGLGFTDYFEELIFDMYIVRDGYMLYDPVTNYMFDARKIKMFYVEQDYRPIK